jgi:riboflavin kinase, archaea type
VSASEPEDYVPSGRSGGADASASDSVLSTQYSVLAIEGVLRDGLRVAAQFTELPWVREQFQRKLGLDVWPGTVNLQVQGPAGLAALARLRRAPDEPGGILTGVPIEPPPSPGAGTGRLDVSADVQQPPYCVGYCFPASIGGLPAAIVIPHVPDYPADKLELVAAVRVRDALGIQPGDRVEVTVMTGGGPTPPAPSLRGKGERTRGAGRPVPRVPRRE